MQPLVVVGASAGGLDPLKELVSGLAPNFAGALVVVMHVPPAHKSHLPALLSSSGPLRAIEVTDRMRIEAGQIYIAAPDFHLLVEEEYLQPWHGPRENMHRPSINTTFRSVAESHREKAIGVILSGHLDDGSMGLWHLKQRGGIAVVQNPKGAVAPSMPENALMSVNVDYCVAAKEIGPLLSRLTAAATELQASRPTEKAMDMIMHPLTATCPECHGPLSEGVQGSLREYRCLVGHSYSARTVLLAHHESEERALWQAKVRLEESARLLERLADTLSPQEFAVLKEYTDRKVKYASTIRDLLEGLGPFPATQ